jgi:hypothetical protein
MATMEEKKVYNYYNSVHNEHGQVLTQNITISGCVSADVLMQLSRNFFNSEPVEVKGEETKEEESEEQLYPALRLLCSLVREAVNEKRSAKYILMPQRAAMEAEVMLPPMDAAWYNRRFGTHLNKMNLSNWLNGTGKSDYDPKELEPMVTRFMALK